MYAKSRQSCLALGDFMDSSLSGSSIHGIPQARILSGLPFLLPGDLPDPGMEPTSLMSPASAGKFFTTEPPGVPCSKIIITWKNHSLSIKRWQQKTFRSNFKGV